MSGSSDIVRVRFLPIDDAVTTRLPDLLTILDDQERHRAERFHFERDRDAFIAAHALARSMLSDATGAPTTSLRFVEGHNGKPEIAPEIGSQHVHFNISHTHELVACAVSADHAVGVDVEASDRPTDLGIAHRYFAPEETAIVLSAVTEQRQELFYKFWTLKEAFIKATGEGLSRPLASFAFTLDPIRIAFHPERDDAGRTDRPEHWQFTQCCPIPNRFLALALRRPNTVDVSLDIRAARLDEIVSPRWRP